METRVPRKPAQYGKAVVSRISTQWLIGLSLMITVTALLGLGLGFTSPVFIAAEFLFIAIVFAIERRVIPGLNRRERGNEGEEHVGAILDGLSDHGWLTIHDVSLERGNVDHIAIGPGGIVTVETKSHGGRIKAGKLDPAWLRQAYAQRKQIERITNMEVDSLLVFSRAYLDRPISRQRGVLVLTARYLEGHLADRAAVMTADQAQALHARLSAALPT